MKGAVVVVHPLMFEEFFGPHSLSLCFSDIDMTLTLCMMHHYGQILFGLNIFIIQHHVALGPNYNLIQASVSS